MKIMRLLEIIAKEEHNPDDYVFACSIGITAWETPIRYISIEEMHQGMFEDVSINYGIVLPKDNTIAKVLVLYIGDNNTTKHETLRMSDLECILNALHQDMEVVCKWTRHPKSIPAGVINFFEGYGYDCREDHTREEFGNDICIIMI